MYNIQEIFDIGVEIEKSGMAFYKKAADTVEDENLKNLFNELSEWESGHITLFEKLKSKVYGDKEEINAGPEDEYHKYIKAASDAHVFMANKDAAELAEKCGTPRDIIKLAIGFEKDSIVLFTAIRETVSDKWKSGVDRLIKEELKHIVMLNEKHSSI